MLETIRRGFPLLGLILLVYPLPSLAHDHGEAEEHAPADFVTSSPDATTVSDPATAPEGLPDRLVIGMDGLPYDEVSDMQKTEGLFEEFFPVSRSIAPFPSISDISWADIFRTVPPRGYQRYHYSVRGNQIIGGSTTDLGNPIEYEKRMHMAFMKVTEHAYAYLFPMKAAYDEVNALSERFLRTRGVESYYAYFLSTDTLQHTAGDIRELLRYLDRKLVELQERYRALTGRQLKIVIVSDHGNNDERDGELVGMKSHLEDRGWNFGDSVVEDDDVVFTNSGILTSVAIFVKEGRYEAVARDALEAKGVDTVSYVEAGDENLVHVLNPEGEVARIRRSAEDPGRYRYEQVQGDLLDYAPVVERLTAAGKADAGGFIHGDDWLEATSDHHYPAAPERIWRGHHEITLNTAPVLVGIKDGYENANSFVKFASNFKSRGGTHGNLGADCSNGVIMTNYVPTADTTSNRVGEEYGFGGLFNYKRHRQGARLVDSDILAYDVDSQEWINSTNNFRATNQVFLNIWDRKVPVFEPMGLQTRFRVTVKRDGFLIFNLRETRRDLIASTLPHTLEMNEFRVPMQVVVPDFQEPGSFILTVEALRIDPETGFLFDRENLTTLRFFTDIDGNVVAY